MNPKSLFRSFLQAGFECSTHVLRNGRRLDLVASTQHDVLVDRDFARLTNIGIYTAREGLRWHLIENEAGKYDFSSALSIIEAARRRGVQVIWDLVHFGWPAFWDIFDKRWVTALADFASAFGQLLREHMGEPAFVAPINEISFLSWAGGDQSVLNPFAINRGAELKRQLVMGAIEASKALRDELPSVRLVSPEPVIHIVGDASKPGDILQAEQYRSAMFESWDMLSGRAAPELGGDEIYLDVVGVNYYDRNQWWNHGKTIKRDDSQYRPFRDILEEVHSRYQRSIFVAETGTEDDARPTWFAYVANEVREAMAAGVPLEGICLYPILNHPGWEDNRHCRNGLWDYPQPNGEREIYQPLAEEIKRQNFQVTP